MVVVRGHPGDKRLRHVLLAATRRHHAMNVSLGISRFIKLRRACTHCTLSSSYPLVLSILSSDVVDLPRFMRRGSSTIGRPDRAQRWSCFSSSSQTASGVIKNDKPRSCAPLRIIPQRVPERSPTPLYV